MSNPLNSDGLQAGDAPVDLNLIQLDAKFEISSGFSIDRENVPLPSFDGTGQDDDFIFEEFARIRLKGHEDGLDDTEA